MSVLSIIALAVFIMAVCAVLIARGLIWLGKAVLGVLTGWFFKEL